MSADEIDIRAWLRTTRERVAAQAPASQWRMDDFKLSVACREYLTRPELLYLLEMACDKRFDRRKDIGRYLEIQREYIDGMVPDGLGTAH